MIYEVAFVLNQTLSIKKQHYKAGPCLLLSIFFYKLSADSDVLLELLKQSPEGSGELLAAMAMVTPS